MHTEMWEHPATLASVRTLRERGCLVLDPASGRLTGADAGPGRLPEPAELYQTAVRVLARGSAGLAPDLAGRRVVISAGGTREELDPVRFIGNWSSGRQGYALARTAAARGAEVTLVSANVDLAEPAGTKVERVTSACQLRSAMLAAAEAADALVMAAAVADYRPAEPAAGKRPKDTADWTVRLEPTQDILRGLGESRENGQLLVGFAADTGETGLARAREKLETKRADLIVFNDITREGIGFDAADNEVVLISREGERTVPRARKESIAAAILDAVEELLPG
jgi:phosphopantothenoylcysteine decarboxylase/phosphopantothenate--cysteine ligase